MEKSMKDQLKTIRDGLENFTEPYLQKALTALTQLEAMVGEQNPVAYCWEGHYFDTLEEARTFSQNNVGLGDEITYLFGRVAAPVAQQPQANSIESGGIKTDQQPQAECAHRWPGSIAVPGTFWCFDCGERSAQPQAEAVPSDVVRDAERYRWLTEDHASLTVRAFVDQIAQRISIRGKGATDYAIDAAMAQGAKP